MDGPHTSIPVSVSVFVFNRLVLIPKYYFFAERRYLVSRLWLAYSGLFGPLVYQHYRLVALRFSSIHVMRLG